MTSTKTQDLYEVDIRDVKSAGPKALSPYIDNLVSVVGSTRAGTASMLGVLTGITYSDTMIVVYMEGQQNTAFDPTKSGVWLSIA